jgi:hypothetical protein
MRGGCVPLDPAQRTASIQAAIADANAVVTGLQGLVFPEPTSMTFKCSLLSEKYTKDILGAAPASHAREFDGTDFIYTFRIIPEAENIPRDIIRLFTEARALQSETDYDGKKDYCKANENPSQYLYVGRSKKLRSRLSQHLGAKHEGIFAMHLQRWATRIDCEIEIAFYRFDGRSNLIVQAIEDGVWKSVLPMLGRQGEQ